MAHFMKSFSRELAAGLVDVDPAFNRMTITRVSSSSWSCMTNSCALRRRRFPRERTKAHEQDFIILLFALKTRPGLMVGDDASASAIEAFVSGAIAGRRKRRFKLSLDEKRYLRFEPWLNRKHGFKDFPSHQILRILGDPRETQHTTFFREYESFLTQGGRTKTGLDDLCERVQAGTAIKYVRKNR